MTSPLTEQVKQNYSDLPASWLNDLWLIVRCIMIGQTTNLARLKDHVPAVLDTDKAHRTKPQSHYARLIRFFRAVAHPDSPLPWRMRQFIAELTLRIIGSEPRLRGRLSGELALNGIEWDIRGDKD